MSRRVMTKRLGWICAAAMVAAGCQGPAGDLAGRAMFAIGQEGQAPGLPGVPAASMPESDVTLPSDSAPPGSGPLPAPLAPAGGGPAGPVAPALPPAAHGEVTVSFQGLLKPASQRRVLATTADIAKVRVTITPASGNPVSQEVTAAQIAAGVTSVTFTGLYPGPAQVVIYAFDVNDQVIGSSTQTVAVVSNINTNVAITVTLNPTYTGGPGGLNTTITFVDGPVVSGWPPGTILGIYQTGKFPEAIAFNATGHAFIANFEGDSVTKLAPDGTVLGTFDVRVGQNLKAKPTGLAVNPATGNVWVADELSSFVYVIDPTAGTELAKYPAGPVPSSIAFDALGNAWFTNYVYKAVTVLKPTGAPGGGFGVGEYPIAQAFDAMGNAWILNFKGESISICSPLTGKVTKTITLEANSEPERIVIDPMGFAWVTHNKTNKVSKIDATGAYTQQFAVGKLPRGIAVDQSGNIWVANGGSNDVTRLSPDGLVLGTFKVGRNPRAIKVDPAGYVWVTCADDNTVYKLQP